MAAALLSVIARAQTPVFTTGTPPELELARSIGLDELSSRTRQPGVELRVTRVSVDQISMAHVRVQQLYRGIPVFGGEAVAHLRSDGTLSSITDNLVPDIRVDVTPMVSAADAIERARTDARVPAASPDAPTVSLWILRRDRTDHLVHRIELEPLVAAAQPRRPVVFVDAHTGDIVFQYDNLQTAPLP